MARVFRLWEKKRGTRRTGSRRLGNLGEALFSGVMFLFGLISLTAVVSSYLLQPDPRMLQIGFGFWLTVVVLASIMLLGLGGVIHTIFQAGTSAERRSAFAKRASDLDLNHGNELSPEKFPNVPRDENMTNSPGVHLRFRLPAAQSSTWRTVVAMAFCVVWNSAAVMLVVLVVERFLIGQPDWFLTLFTLPFLIIGGWAIYDFIRQILMHAGIGPTHIEISDHPLFPGRRYQIHISQSGRLFIKHFAVRLVCEEQTTYRQGTDLRTETCKVFDCQIFSEKDFQIEPEVSFQRELEIEVPAAAMHSFQSEHNAINWKIEVRGRASSWPPFHRTYPIIIYPRGGSETEIHGTAHRASVA